MTEGLPVDERSARLLRDARWMAGLTQAQVASRAGVARQVVVSYETGRRRPSVQTLDRLLAGCGVRLRLSLVPEPGLEDEPTLELLDLPALERVDLGQQRAMVALCRAVGDPRLLLVAGKAAARLHGASVRVWELEVWFAQEQPVADIERWLAAAGMFLDVNATEPLDLRDYDLQTGVTLCDDSCVVRVRAVEHFAGFLDRSIPLDLAGLPGVPDEPGLSLVRVAEPDDCARGWHPRDLDHLALQRAVRLAAETGR